MRPEKYLTKQKQAIKELLAENQGQHLSVQDMCRALEEKNISVGRTTVYRYLENMYAQGLVRRINEPGGACYVYGEACRDSYHLVCNTCGRLSHLHCAEFDKLKRHFLEIHGFEIDGFQTTVTGKCKSCREKEGLK